MGEPVVQIVPVKTFENNSYSIESYANDMIRDGMYFVENEEYELKDDWKYAYDIFLNKLLGYVEEKELQKLHTKETDAYKRFEAMFQKIAEATKTNFIVLVGHIETCVNFINKSDIEELKPSNSYPTIILVVACYSEERLRGLNEFSSNKILYMGFSSLMHVYDGEIYQCPNPFVGEPSLECRYKGSEQNLELYSTNATKGAKLVECIKARIFQYEKAFVEAFQTRKCKKIRAEDFIPMILRLKKDEFHFWDHETLAERDKANHTNNNNNNEDIKKAYWIVDTKIGLPCTPQSPCGKVPTEMNNSIHIFDKETKYLEIYKNIIETIKSIRYHDVHVNKESFVRKKDQQLESYLNALSIEDAEKILEYNVNDTPIFFTILLYKLKICMKLLFSKYKVNFSLRNDIANETILFHLLRIHSISNNNRYSFSSSSNERTYTTKELYRLFLQIYRIKPEVFLEINNYGEIPLAKLFNNLKENYPLILFYFKYFPNHKTYGDSILKNFLKTAKGPQDKILDCLELLFINGVNPNETEGFANDFKTMLEVYVDTEEKFYQKEIINLFVAYGFKNLKIIEGFRKYYYNLLTNRSAYDMFIRKAGQFSYLERNKLILQDPSLYIRKAIEAFSLEGPFPRKMELSQLKIQLEKDTKPYEEGFEKINSIKDLFKEIQQFVKKLKIEQSIKNDFLEEARRIYMSKNGENENEGNSAVRRYSMIESIFQEFKQLYAPETFKKPAALPPINAWGGAFKKTRKRNQKKKTRRTKRG